MLYSLRILAPGEGFKLLKCQSAVLLGKFKKRPDFQTDSDPYLLKVFTPALGNAVQRNVAFRVLLATPCHQVRPAPMPFVEARISQHHPLPTHVLVLVDDPVRDTPQEILHLQHGIFQQHMCAHGW